MTAELTARAVEWLMSPYDQTVHAFWSEQVAGAARGLIRAWCTQLVPAQLLIPTPGELCPLCRLVFRTQLPGCELPLVGE